MKFGEELEKQLVPEWYTQYLDYNLGKIKLDKLVSLLENLPHYERVPPPAPSADVCDNASLNSVEDEPWALTAEMFEEVTPLLNRQRSQSTSVLYRKSLLADHQVSHEESIDIMAKRRFIDWVDEQLDKVSGFYRQRQNLYRMRFLILSDQLQQLQRSRDCPNHHTFIRISHPWIESPSLPDFFWNRNGEKPKQYYQEGYIDKDAAFINVNAPDLEIAEKMLKKALYELYHVIELLDSFKTLNQIAFRKLVKKYDKRTHNSTLLDYMNKVNKALVPNKDFIPLGTEIEDLYTKYFTNGNRKMAMTRLKTIGNNETFYGSTFFGGIFLGISICLIYKIIINLKGENPFFLQLWASLLLVSLSGLYFSIDCWIFERYKINYKLVFEINSQFSLNFREYMFVFSTIFCIGSILAYQSIQYSINYMPHIFLLCLTALLIMPFNVLYFKSRLWIIESFIRLALSGFYPVLFRDFFFGVITCSLTYPIANIVLFFCTFNNGYCGTECGPNKSIMMGLLSALPPFWRVLQCFRRFADTGDWFPHFANLIKYSITTAYFLCLSISRLWPNKSTFAGFIFIAIVNASYSSFWDVFMDWSLCQADSENFLLRDVLIYRHHSIYYIATLVDVLMRFQWIIFLVVPSAPLAGFSVAFVELTRRFIWLIFRMENEHATNAYLFKVSRECQLPYPLHVAMKRVASIQSTATNEGYDSIRNENEHSESESIYSMASGKSTKSNWGNLSKIISKAHVMEFQRSQKR